MWAFRTQLARAGRDLAASGHPTSRLLRDVARCAPWLSAGPKGLAVEAGPGASSTPTAAGAAAGGQKIETDRGPGEAEGKGSSGWGWYALIGLAGCGGGLYMAKEYGYLDGFLKTGAQVQKPNYDAVRNAIADIMEKEDYDDGSYGPVLVRLAWHASGTYDKATDTGGSGGGATMRFSPECDHAANAGLNVARDLLEPIKKQFPWISYADLWTLAGAVAIEEMGGPTIPWRPGRSDAPDGGHCTPDGRLPDGDKGPSHLRDIFYRMGFNDQEIVALAGAHTLGRCHADRSGWVNPWTRAPTTFSNLFFEELLSTKWRKKKNFTPMQYEDPTGELMMLPSDLALVQDRKFRKYVELYAKDQDKFFEDFAAAFSKLLELGVKFPQVEAKSA